MKKIKIITVLLCMSVVLGACGQSNEKEATASVFIATDGQEKSESVAETREESSEKMEYQKDENIPRTLAINSTVKYCVDTPDSVESRAGSGYIVNGDNYFVIYGHYLDTGSESLYGVDITKIQSPSDALEEMQEQFLWTSREGLIWADKYSMNVDAKEEITVNDWDMCRYEGQVLLESEYTLDYNTAEFAAYTVIKDGYPVFFAVFDDPTDEEKADIVTIADKIAKTFREYSEE